MNLFRKKLDDLDNETESTHQLQPCLTSFDLIFLGIGAIIGAGIFVLTGIAAATKAGPAIVISYIISACACAFSALSYAELAASIGGCGSAYSYAYRGMGEIWAWIIGWDLLLEYSISVSAVSVGWSSYVGDLLRSIHAPISSLLLHSPHNGGFINLPALLIILLLTLLLCLGAKTSSRVNNLMVIIKLSVIGLFIVIASFHVNPKNWHPFAPFGFHGILDGAAFIFFAYIGFDAVSTTAEEAINPKRDLPIGIICSLLICTVIYILVSGLLTSVAPYQALNVSSPISHILLDLNYHLSAAIISVGAIAGLTTVMLVMYYGLTRVFFAMSRDQLLPSFFNVIHPITKTPVRIILTSALLMSLLGAFLPIKELVELVNIGTLFAFITVCCGVIVLRITQPDLPRSFKTPASPLFPILGIVSCFYLIIHLPYETIIRFLIWLILGLVVYFKYSRFQSRLQIKAKT